jgi:DNA-directed RNA polymerase subunit RPC12/RpoP
MGLFGPKCPYCKGKNLYLKRTWPTEVYGCKDCEVKAALLQKKGLSKKEIEKILTT